MSGISQASSPSNPPFLNHWTHTGGGVAVGVAVGVPAGVRVMLGDGEAAGTCTYTGAASCRTSEPANCDATWIWIECLPLTVPDLARKRRVSSPGNRRGVLSRARTASNWA